MKYVPPYGIADPDAPYINGDPSIGRMGSIPPAEAFEHPMRELVAVIDRSTLVPDEDDLEQVAKGIRSQRMNYCEDTGSVNTLSVALDPPITSYSIGLPLRVKIKNPNTGPATIDAGAGRVSIRKPTGAEVAAGDLPAGGLAELVYDGTVFQMINYGGTGGGGTGSVFQINIPYAVDTGTVNNVVATFTGPALVLAAGLIVMVKVNNTNTSFSTLNINNLGAKQIYAQGGTANWPLMPSDMIKNDVLVFVYDGTRFWIYANTVLDQYVTLNVANNAQITDLFIALGRKRILGSGYVTVQLATGIYSRFITYHPNADRIIVQGTMLAAPPTNANFYKTGNSPANRAQDSANNIAMLRSRYGTEIRIDNTTLSTGIYHYGGGSMYFKNLLVTGPNVTAPGNSGYLIMGMGVGGGSTAFMENCAVWGSGGMGIGTGGGTIQCQNCFATSCAIYGFVSDLGGTMQLVGCGSFGNAGPGIFATRSSVGALEWRSGTPGAPDIPPTESVGNASFGVFVTAGSQMEVIHASVYSNSTDHVATNMSYIELYGPNAYNTTSPAPGVIGNNNALVALVAQ